MSSEQPSTAPEEKVSSRRTFLTLSAFATLSAGIVGTAHHTMGKILGIDNVQKADDPEAMREQGSLRTVRTVGNVGLAVEALLGAGWLCAEIQRRNRPSRTTVSLGDAEDEIPSLPYSLNRGPHAFVSPEDLVARDTPPYQSGPRVLDFVAS